MAYINVTSNTAGISFTLGVYSTALGFSKFFRLKQGVLTVALRPEWIEYTTIDGKSYSIAPAPIVGQSNILVVETVNGVTPTDLNHLYDLLLDILQ
jgi:hypothetical protein